MFLLNPKRLTAFKPFGGPDSYRRCGIFIGRKRKIRTPGSSCERDRREARAISLCPPRRGKFRDSKALAKARAFSCSTAAPFPHATRFAGLARGPFLAASILYERHTEEQNKLCSSLTPNGLLRSSRLGALIRTEGAGFLLEEKERFELPGVHASATGGKRELSPSVRHVAASSAIPKPSQKRGLFHALLPLLFPTRPASLGLRGGPF